MDGVIDVTGITYGDLEHTEGVNRTFATEGKKYGNVFNGFFTVSKEIAKQFTVGNKATVKIYAIFEGDILVNKKKARVCSSFDIRTTIYYSQP